MNTCRTEAVVCVCVYVWRAAAAVRVINGLSALRMFEDYKRNTVRWVQAVDSKSLARATARASTPQRPKRKF